MNMNKLKQVLKWYFCDSASVLGLRSNYYTILNTAYGTMPFMENESLLGNLKKIHEHRLIHQAVNDLSREQYRYLEALYYDEYQVRYPPVIRHVFGEKTGLCLCLAHDMKELLSLCIKHRQDCLTAEERLTLNRLMDETDKRYHRLHEFLRFNTYIRQLGK